MASHTDAARLDALTDLFAESESPPVPARMEHNPMRVRQRIKETFMVIWSGWGILAALIPAAYMFGGTALINILPDGAAAALAPWYESVLLLLAAVTVWFAGSCCNTS